MQVSHVRLPSRTILIQTSYS